MAQTLSHRNAEWLGAWLNWGRLGSGPGLALHRPVANTSIDQYAGSRSARPLALGRRRGTYTAASSSLHTSATVPVRQQRLRVRSDDDFQPSKSQLFDTSASSPRPHAAETKRVPSGQHSPRRSNLVEGHTAPPDDDGVFGCKDPSVIDHNQRFGELSSSRRPVRSRRLPPCSPGPVDPNAPPLPLLQEPSLNDATEADLGRAQTKSWHQPAAWLSAHTFLYGDAGPACVDLPLPSGPGSHGSSLRNLISQYISSTSRRSRKRSGASAPDPPPATTAAVDSGLLPWGSASSSNSSPAHGSQSASPSPDMPSASPVAPTSDLQQLRALGGYFTGRSLILRSAVAPPPPPPRSVLARAGEQAAKVYEESNMKVRRRGV